MNRFVLDWLAGDPKATRFLPRGPASAPPSSAPNSAPPSPALVSALVESNRRWGSFVQDNLAAWSRGETVSIVAGQQVGLAGGPLYTLSKLATLIRMKRDIEKHGRRATLFFWLATEDHDFDEVARMSVPVSSIPASRTDVNRQLDLLSIRAARSVESRQVVGPMPVPEPLIEQLLALYDMQRPEWLRKGVTFRDSFAELLVSIFGQEIVLVDSLLPELRQAGAPLFQSLFARWNEVEDAIAASSRAMEEGGYAAQIEQRDGGRYTLLYRLDDNGERHIIEKPEDLGDPATISTSAMTRPLLQDFVLRPDVFVGGPAEVAYYAQQVGLHELLGVDMPRVALRGHALVAPKKLLRTLERYGISAGEVFGTPEEVLARDEPASVEEIRRIADDARRNLSKAMTRIGEIALPAEHAVARALNRSIGHIEYHFEKLTQRAIRALVRKDRERFAAVRELIANFYPDRHVQERVVGWFPFWCQYGKHLVDSMINEIEPDSATFRMIGL